MTYFPSNFFNSSATGLRVNFSFFFPSGRPRCEHKTTDLAFFSRANFMDGRAATILALFVIAPVDLSWGTLKSHLKNLWKPILIYFMILTENCKFSKRNIIKISQWHIDSYYLIKTLFPSRSKESIESLLRAIVDDFWIGNVKKWWNKVTGRSKKVTSKTAYHQNRCGRYFVWYSPIRCMNRQRNRLLRQIKAKPHYVFMVFSKLKYSLFQRYQIKWKEIQAILQMFLIDINQ